MTTAVAYYRTSSATGLGDGLDSEGRQRDAVKAYATRAGLEVTQEFYDAAVRGTDSVGDRDGFAAMMEYMAGSGVRVILVENASRFARDLLVQLTGHQFLKERGIDLIPVDCPTHFQEETPTAIMVRQILGAVSEFEKRSLVDKMKKARDRKRRETGRCEGRKPAPQAAIDMANALRRQGLSLREIASHLSKEGFTVMERVKGTSDYAPTGREYGAQSVKKMLR